MPGDAIIPGDTKNQPLPAGIRMLSITPSEHPHPVPLRRETPLSPAQAESDQRRLALPQRRPLSDASFSPLASPLQHGAHEHRPPEGGQSHNMIPEFQPQPVSQWKSPLLMLGFFC